MQKLESKEKIGATLGYVRMILTETLLKASEGKMNHYDAALIIGSAKQINYSISNELKYRDQQIKISRYVPKLGNIEIE